MLINLTSGWGLDLKIPSSRVQVLFRPQGGFGSRLTQFHGHGHGHACEKGTGLPPASWDFQLCDVQFEVCVLMMFVFWDPIEPVDNLK